MMPDFSSTELKQLLQLELAEGGYLSPEEALLAGLRVLRQSRACQSQLADRIASLQDGRAIVLEGDEQLAEFLDQIDQEVDAELKSNRRRDS